MTFAPHKGREIPNVESGTGIRCQEHVSPSPLASRFRQIIIRFAGDSGTVSVNRNGKNIALETD